MKKYSKRKTVKLGEVCKKITDGSHFSPISMKNGFPIATIKNMSDRSIDIRSCRRISKNDFATLIKNGCSPTKGDILFSKDGTVGKNFVYSQNEQIVLLSSIAIITPNKDKIDSWYCSYVLKSPYVLDSIIRSKTGSAITRIVLKDIRELKIPLPPLGEQKKMVEILDRENEQVSGLINHYKEIKNLLEKYKQSLFSSFIDSKWKSVELGSVITLVKKRNNSGSIPYVGMENIESFGGRLLSIPEIKNVESATFHFSSNYVLYGRLRP